MRQVDRALFRRLRRRQARHAQQQIDDPLLGRRRGHAGQLGDDHVVLESEQLDQGGRELGERRELLRDIRWAIAAEDGWRNNARRRRPGAVGECGTFAKDRPGSKDLEQELRTVASVDRGMNET
ncbi:hypothetical protein D9M68_872700 [compost metagenome]